MQFSRIIPEIICGKDVCAVSDDKNPGAYNAFKHCGKRVGCLCLLLDLLKGFVPVFAAFFVIGAESSLFSAVMLAPVLGHAVGLFNGFQGGKGIATSFGVTFAVIPVTFVVSLTLVALYVAFSTVIKICPNRKRSIVTYILFAVIACTTCCVMRLYSVALGSVLVAGVVIFKHIIAKPAPIAEEEASDEIKSLQE